LETIAISIDGKNISCPAGTSVLEAAQNNGIKIPSLCHHPDLKPYGACRLCLVEDEKTGRLMAACVTPATQGMVIRTATSRIINHRRNITRLMIAEHPESCIVCSKGNRCQLRWVAAQLGIGETELYRMPNYKTLEQANPFIIRDLSKCILCGKCIRADHELVVVGAIDYNLRGFKSRPTTVHDTGLKDSSCTFCGTCVSVCPTGALSIKNMRYIGSPQRETLSVCGFCGVGCSLAMGVVDEKVVEVNPSRRHDSVNRATLCVRGHFAHDFLNAAARLISPLMPKSENGEKTQMVPVSWDAALDAVAGRLMDIKKENGPQSIAFLGSSKCTNEENYLFQKIARVLVGTNHVDNGGYLSGRSLPSLLDDRTDNGCRVNALADLETAQAILVIGADPNHSVPVVSYYLKRAADRGVPMILADPRPTELVKFAALWLQVKPDSDLELINGLTALLHRRNAYDLAFIDRYTENFSLYRYGLSSLDIERVCRVTGLDKSTLEAAAGLLEGKKIAIVVGHGILQQRHRRHCLDALLNLALMTGSLGCRGAGVYLLARENNQSGAFDMGAVPHALPGRTALADPAGRKKWERAWKVKISPDHGLNMMRMLEEAEKGRLKALYIMGENPLRSLPQPDRVRRALQHLDFIVVQDILDTDTARLADVVLSGAAFSEKSGSFTNLEGRIQVFSPVVAPPGEAKADWEILDLLAARMGAAERYGAVEKIREEIRSLIPMYAELDGRAQGWIAQTSQKKLFRSDGQGEMIAFSAMASTGDVASTQAYPLTAIFGSLRFHLGSGTRTGESERIRTFNLKAAIELSPEDAARLDVGNGERVRILSTHGAIERKVRLKKGIFPGQIFIPLALNSNDAMHLIDWIDLEKPDSPGWKTCQVKIEKA
jgi:formate dehydrogenase alpha subunit